MEIFKVLPAFKCLSSSFFLNGVLLIFIAGDFFLEQSSIVIISFSSIFLTEYPYWFSVEVC